jgi:hypothetical protein
VTHWYDHVYMPVVEAIREADLPSEFPRRTQADLYVWIIEHLWYLREAGDLAEATPLHAVARTFGACYSSHPRARLARILRVVLTVATSPFEAFRSSREAA